MFKTPILFLVFNRPDSTEIVFEKIRSLKPERLYIGADGPRPDKPEDLELCETTRRIFSRIDWDCEVETLFQNDNLGCGLAPATAISWFFEKVNEGIILEDDCVPNDSFFHYCEELLQVYRTQAEIFMICGTSYQPKPLNENTYYFSNYPHVWGWATWKRTWQKYNFNLSGENETMRASVIKRRFFNWRERKFWIRNMKMIVNGLDAWDYQMMYWMWKNDAVCITPWRNMISNIGFGEHGTHTLDADSVQSQMLQHEISNFKHPINIRVNKQADNYERHAILIGFKSEFLKNKAIGIKNRFLRLLKIDHAK